MADETDPPVAEDKESSPAAKKLGDFVRSRFKELATDRYGEDSTWFVSGLMNLGKQWMTRDSRTDRLRPMTSKDVGQNWTMPVSDHFSKTIATNANALGARLPRVTALSGNWDSRSRRAAAYAEAVFDTANKESGMDVLNPILAIQNVLWGIGVTKDSIAFDMSTEDIPILGEQTPMGEVQTGTAPPAKLPTSTPAAPAPQTINPQTGTPADAPATPPPTVGSPETPETPPDETPQVIGTERVPVPRLKTTLPSPFCVYIPRDCQDPNLSPETYERVPYTLGEAREMFPDYAAQFKADGSGSDAQGDTAYADSTSASLASYYYSQLRRMGGTVSGSNSATGQGKDSSTVSYITAIEGWDDWSRLPKDVQDAITSEWGDSPSEVEEYAKQGMTRISAAVAYGVFAIVWQDLTLQWGENPNHGDSPYTWFMWEKNACNPYGKGGLGVVLTSLQRQLNRLDALHDRQLMSTGTTKILIGESQQYDSPSGDPVDVWKYDDMVGKHAPQLFPAGNAGGVPAKRQAILAEFAQLGYTEGVSSGNAPGGVDSFRGIAYLGAKEEEQRGTQRSLWEQGHEIRDRKLLRLAKRVWTTPRKIKVAGPNNRYGAELIEGADLDFETDQLTIIQGSSRPKTLQEKEDALNTLIAGGLVDVQDVAVRDYIYDLVGMPEIDLVNALQYSKASRDLQQVLDGIQPVSSPFQDWGIVFKTFMEYTLTEEFEGLPQPLQGGILAYASWAQELSEPPPPPMGGPAPPGGAAMPTPSQNPGKTLSKVPGKSASVGNVQTAATSEGNSVANDATPHYT